ncbi:MAG TPA: trigger factor [Gammaproteobacteria bacterium]|nr:trigger factor [Gammaproteobacteria bacterium]
MQVSLEKVSSVERRLTIVVPAEQVEAAYTKQISAFAQKANIKGFRPGKAPMKVIQERFGGDARKEALGEVIQHALYQAIMEQKLNPISTPQVEPKLMQPNQPLEFIASFEVLPEIEQIAFSMDSIEKLNVEITEADVDRVIDQLSKQYTKWNKVDRAATATDRVLINYYTTFEGKSDQDREIKDFPLDLSGQVMLPGFEVGLVGTKAGETRTLALSFPADFPNAERAGKPIEFTVHVNAVQAPESPAHDEAFAKRLGIASGLMDDLRKQIRQSLTLERDRLVKEKLKEQIFKALIDQNAMDVPKALVEREAKNIHDEMHPHHHDHHSHSAEEMAGYESVAKKRVALGLLIGEFAKKEGIKADEAKVDARIQEIASVYENPKEVVDWLSSKQQRGGVEAQVLEDQVLDKLMSKTMIKEKAMTYAELKGIRI